jgi:peptide/nickel transport system ATP-binding protein
VVVLDEPTTGLDVTTQAHVLATIRRITRHEGAAALYVSHDLSVVGSFADRIAVMYGGRLVEQGPVGQLFRSPAHPYTRLLLAAVPRIEAARTLTAIPGRAPAPGHRPPGCPFAARCALHIAECDAGLPEPLPAGPDQTARCIRIRESRSAIAVDRAPLPVAPTDQTSAVLSVSDLEVSYGEIRVVHGVNLSLDRRECVALVGESGSGKTTVARSIAGLHDRWTGVVQLDDVPLERSARRRPRRANRDLQYIFQNPYG